MSNIQPLLVMSRSLSEINSHKAFGRATASRKLDKSAGVGSGGVSVAGKILGRKELASVHNFIFICRIHQL